MFLCNFHFSTFKVVPSITQNSLKRVRLREHYCGRVFICGQFKFKVSLGGEALSEGGALHFVYVMDYEDDVGGYMMLNTF